MRKPDVAAQTVQVARQKIIQRNLQRYENLRQEAIVYGGSGNFRFGTLGAAG